MVIFEGIIKILPTKINKNLPIVSRVLSTVNNEIYDLLSGSIIRTNVKFYNNMKFKKENGLQRCNYILWKVM